MDQQMSENLEKQRRIRSHLLEIRAGGFELAVRKEKIALIGATVTGMAKYHRFLTCIKPKVLVVEEAAEVTEAMLMASIPPSVEHIVLSGDHQQLRPRIQQHRLQTELVDGVKNKEEAAAIRHIGADVSMFERLVKCGVRMTTLNVQHRMRPCIANLLSPTVYPVLHHGSNVQEYEKVVGLSRSLLFWDHQGKYKEIQDESGSYRNEGEAKQVSKVARYLLDSGLLPEQITVMTPYSNQLLSIQAEMKALDISVDVNEADRAELCERNDQICVKLASLEETSKDIKDKIRLRTVDNFQDEESEIILVSLVRTDKLGFTRSKNRGNVLLSRAKKGLILVGHAGLFSNADGNPLESDHEKVEGPGSYC